MNTEMNTEMNNTESKSESKSGYEVFLENLKKVKVEEDERKMYQIKQRLEEFKTTYYNFKKLPCLKDASLFMYVNDIKHSHDSLKELKTFLISEEGWPNNRLSFLCCVKHNGYIKITFKISEILSV